jgi:uncharacterized protein YkwD
LNDAANFLSSQNPLGTLKPVENLAKVARDLVEAEGKGASQQTQASAYERFSRYGKWDGEMAEMISYGGVSAKEVILQWLVDDGDAERRDRRSIMTPSFQVVGISSGHHSGVCEPFHLPSFSSSFPSSPPLLSFALPC